MAPIPPVGPGAASPAQMPMNLDRLDPARGSTAADLPRAGASSPFNDIQQIVEQLQRILGHLLDPVRTNGQNDEILQLLIGLLVLTAVLNALQGGQAQSQSQEDLFAALARGTAPGSGGTYMTATSLTIEQTVTTVTMQSVEMYTATPSGESAAAGDRIDLAA